MPSRRERLAAGLKHRVAVAAGDKALHGFRGFPLGDRERFGIAPDRLRLVPEAPDPVFSPRSGARLAAGLAEVGLAAGDRSILFVGGISPHKNVETLIDAYALSRSRAGSGLPVLVLVGDLETTRRICRRRSLCGSGSSAHELGAAVLLPGFVTDESSRLSLQRRHGGGDPVARRRIRASCRRSGRLRRSSGAQRPSATP